MKFLKAGDIISGKQGKAIATIEGNIEELFYLKDIEAIAEKQKSTVPVLGKSGDQSKTTGWSGTGSMTLYYVTSVFRKLMLEYIKTGRDVYFDILVENADISSMTRKQTTILKEVNLDSVVMAKLDISNTELDEQTNFTWHDVDMPNLFDELYQ